MAFIITHLYGEMEQTADLSGLSALLDELADADDEHPDVNVSHESGWSLSFFSRGRAIWENVGDSSVTPRHIDGVTREQSLELMGLVAVGDIDAVNAWAWQHGGS